MVEAGYCSIQFFWIVNPIQIHDKYVIDNQNPNQLSITDWQSNPDPIAIQPLVEKFMGANIKQLCLFEQWKSQETFFLPTHNIITNEDSN